MRSGLSFDLRERRDPVHRVSLAEHGRFLDANLAKRSPTRCPTVHMHEFPLIDSGFPALATRSDRMSSNGKSGRSCS